MKIAGILVVFCVSLSAAMVGAMERGEVAPPSVKLTYFALQMVLIHEPHDSDTHKKASILKDFLFPASLERSYLITAHARAAVLGKIEIRSCGTDVTVSSIGEVYASLLGFFDFAMDSTDEMALRIDFKNEIQKILRMTK